MAANNVSLDELTVVLQWLINQRADSVNSRFCVFRIAFDSPEYLGATFGASDAMRRLKQFGRVLTSTVRSSDLIARDVSAFWILMPESDVGVVQSRLRALASQVQEFSLDVVPCSIGAFVFPAKYAEVSSSRELLDRLAALPHIHEFGPHPTEFQLSWASRR